MALAARPANAAEALRVGAAAVVITPPVGTPMAGYYFERAAEGVHDDLFAKAIVLEQGGTKAALVALDLISTTSRPGRGGTRGRSSGPPASRGGNVMIRATHAHTGPGARRAGASATTPSAAAIGPGPPRTARHCPGKIAEAVRRADAGARRPAKVAGGTGEERRSPSTAGST